MFLLDSSTCDLFSQKTSSHLVGVACGVKGGKKNISGLYSKLV